MQYYIIMQVREGVSIFLRLLEVALVAYCILSWVASPLNRTYVFLSRVAQPLVAPFRRIANALIRRGLRFDASALFAILALEIIQSYLMPLLFKWLMTL